ncbi:hypothetical protein BG004_002716 [Podila humilis]|nr:hypothetical protein BG004_002716 [Podila humilis]
MLWPNSSSSSLPKATVDPDADTNFHSSNTNYPAEFINTFDNSRPSSPAPPPQKFNPLDVPATATVVDAPPLRTPPESPIKAYRRDSFRRPSVPPTVLFPVQEQESVADQQYHHQQRQQHSKQPQLEHTQQQSRHIRPGGLQVVPPILSPFSSPPSSPTQRSPVSSIPPRLSLSLAEHPLFRECTPSGIELLASRMHIRHYHPQDHIIRRSEQSSAMFYVLRGTVKVVSHDNEATYYEIKENNFFGDVGVLYRVPRSMDVLAKNRCTIAILSGEDLVKAMEQSPEMAKAIGYQTQERYQMYLKRRQSISVRRTLDGGTGGPDQCQDDPISESFVKSDVHSAIRKVSLFQSCPAEVIHLLSLHVEPRKYNLGESIIRRGEIGREMFFIVSGVVEILSDDNLRVLARFHEGQFFGEIAVLLDVPRIANVKAVSEVEVFVLTKDNLEAVFKAIPSAAEIITAEGNRLYQNWLANSNTHCCADGSDEECNSSMNLGNLSDSTPTHHWAAEDEESMNVQPTGASPCLQRRSFDYERRASVSSNGPTRPRRMSTSLENMHPIEAGHPAAVSVLPLTFTGEFPSGHRIFAQHQSSPSATTAPPPMFGVTEALDAPGAVDEQTLVATPPEMERDKVTVDVLFVTASPQSEPLSTKPQSVFGQDAPMETPSHNSAHEPPVSHNPTIRGLQESNPKRRRASIAVWTQQDLMKLASAAEQKSSLDSSATAPSVASILSQSVNAASATEQEASNPELVQLQSPATRQPKTTPMKRLMGPATFQDLDETIVVRILDRLPLNHLVRIRTVCKAWDKLVMEHDGILQELDLSPFKKNVHDMTLIDLCNTVLSRNKTRTTRVSLRDCFSVSDVGLARLAAHIPAVQELDLHSCWNVTDVGFRSLGEHCQQLESVDFSNCRKLGDGTIFGLYPKPVSLPAPQYASTDPPTLEEDIQMTQDMMEHLSSPSESQDSSDQESDDSASQRRIVRPAVANAVIEGPKGCSLLSKLNLSYCKNLTDTSFTHLAMYGGRRLQSLNLQRCTTISPQAFMSLDSTSRSMFAAATAAAKNGTNGTSPSMEEDQANFQDDLIDPCFPDLKELYLSDCTFLTDAAIISLAPHVPRLRDISLSFCCALTDISIEAISDHCKHLCKMDLSFCGSAVSDASLYRLAQGSDGEEDMVVDRVEDATGVIQDGREEGGEDSCKDSPMLQELEIRGCVRVTELGVREILNGCKHLRKLNISSCSGIGTATLLAEEEEQGDAEKALLLLQQDQKQQALEQVQRMQPLQQPQAMDGVAMASPQAEIVTTANIATATVPTSSVTITSSGDMEVDTLVQPLSSEGTAPIANNPQVSGSLAQGRNSSSTELTRKMLALKRGKEWALAQQRPGLEIIV